MIRSPLRRQLIFLALASLLPMATLSAVGLAVLFESQREAEQRRTLEITRALASAVDSELRRSISSLQVMAAAIEQDNLDLDSFDDLAWRTLQRQPLWRSIILAAPDGRQVAHSEFPRGTPIPANPDPPSVEYAARAAKPVVGNLVRGRVGWAFGVRVPLLKDGRVRYVLSAVMTPQPILDIVPRQQVREDWVISVFDAQGLRVARSRAHEKFVGTRGSESLVKLVGSGALEGTGESTTVEGEALFTAFARVPEFGWTVVMGLPRSLLLAPAIRSTSIYAVALAISTIAGLLLAFGLARRIDRSMADLRGARAEAEEANRAKDQFLAMLGHELRNPIAAISNAVHLLEVTDRKPEAAARARDIVKRQVTHLARLTDDLLDAARAVLGKIELRLQPVDLAASAANALASLAASGRGSRHLIERHLDEAWVSGDPVRLEQVISNLLVNAVKYTPEGGRITVRTGVEGGNAWVSVSDEGAGLTPELAARVFDLFVQGKRAIDRSQGGLGIGLTLVKRLSELHGGSATVTSEGEQRGSEFVVRIPAIPAHVHAESGVRPVHGRSLAVLLVEDNDDARDALKALIDSKGHRVETARDGVTGLEKALAMAPDLAIVDLGLPGLDGFEIARRMRASSLMNNTYLVALTGYGTADARERAIAAGFDGHFTKPISPETLDELLFTVGAQSTPA